MAIVLLDSEQVDFKQIVEDLKLTSSKATEDFLSQDPRSFYRAFIRTTCKCDYVVNNMDKTFKAYIIHTRSKHLMYMLEDIRMALMERMAIKKETMKLQKMRYVL